jgi:hypothetical protein
MGVGGGSWFSLVFLAQRLLGPRDGLGAVRGVCACVCVSPLGGAWSQSTRHISKRAEETKPVGQIPFLSLRTPFTYLRQVESQVSKTWATNHAPVVRSSPGKWAEPELTPGFSSQAFPGGPLSIVSLQGDRKRKDLQGFQKTTNSGVSSDSRVETGRMLELSQL